MKSTLPPILPNPQNEDYKLVLWQFLIFLIAFFLQGGFPFLSKEGLMILGKIIDMLFITGTILLAIKMARDGWDLAAAGYTVLGIGWGVIFAAIDFHHFDLDQDVRTSAAYFFIPSMMLIATYRPFPRWLKWLTLWCIVPFTVSLFSFLTAPEKPENLLNWLSIGFLSFHITGVLWGYYFFRKLRLEIRKGKTLQHLDM